MTQSVFVYKILRPDEWHQLRETGRFAGSPDDLTDGFVHLSTRAQLSATLDRHFGADVEVVVARLTLSSDGDKLRWEPSRRGELFPHLYRALTSADIAEHWRLAAQPSKDGDEGDRRGFLVDGVIPR